MLAASPVTASIAVTSLETIFSAVRFSSTLAVLSAWSLFPQALRARAAPAMSIKARIRYSQFASVKKRGCREVGPQQSRTLLGTRYRQPLQMPTPPRTGAPNYIALLVDVLSVAFIVMLASVAFMSVAFMSVALRSVVAFMSVVVRFSSTFMVLLALSLLLQAATARAAPATRIRARIQDSLDYCDLQRFPASQIARTIV